MEKALVLIKPDATQRNLTGAIINRLEQAGLRLVAIKMIHLDKALARHHYDIHQGKPFFNDLIDYITSGSTVAAIFEGEKAVEISRKTAGATDPAKAETGTIRADFGLDVQRNSIHASDSPETALKEIRLFFNENEIFA
ncbi:MAG: nucleoside-diphosphate kinase [Dehalococcoidales bacterium]|nr:nucleoside-diphosphate kinase [Dehalococcoidales bacterium]